MKASQWPEVAWRTSWLRSEPGSSPLQADALSSRITLCTKRRQRSVLKTRALFLSLCQSDMLLLARPPHCVSAFVCSLLPSEHLEHSMTSEQLSHSGWHLRATGSPQLFLRGFNKVTKPLLILSLSHTHIPQRYFRLEKG